MQVSIANFSEANNNERLDPQFFKPEFVDSYNEVKNMQHSLLSEVAHITDVNHLKIAEDFDETEGVRYLRGQDLGADMMLNDRNVVYIPETVYDTLKRSHIYKNDVLITIVGANTGLVGLVYSAPEKLVANCKLGIARAYNGKVRPGYLYAFLTCKYGQHQILRSIRGGGQTGLILPDMRRLLVARLSEGFENAVNNVVLTGHEKIIESKNTFLNTETVLLAELGLSNWQPKHQLSFVKYYSDTVEAGRIDAEYFQPKYDEIVKAIKSYSGGWDIQVNLVKLKDKNYSLENNTEYKYIELSNITGNGEIADCMVAEGQNLPSRARRKVATGDVIVSSIEGSLSSIALIEKEYDQALCSTGFYVINSKKFNSETLLVLLKSIVGQLQLKKRCSGTILTVINQDEFKQIVLPIICDKAQKHIQQKITEAFNFHKQSKHLLQCAKRAVEIAIEQNEDKAINWLKDQTNTLVAINADKWQNKKEEVNDDEGKNKKSSAKSGSVAEKPRGHKRTEEGISGENFGLGSQVHGVREGAGEYDPAEGTPGNEEDSTRPLDSTRYFETSRGRITYSEVAEILAVSVTRTIEAIVGQTPEDIQWIHPFKDFNGRVGRIILSALLYRLKLPPAETVSVEIKEIKNYLKALRVADGGDLSSLTEIWMERLLKTLNEK